jgi:DNA-binding transcriptional MerR regulator
MSQAEDPHLLEHAREHGVSVEDVRQLMGASTPHFALQLRERIARLIADLPPEHPARIEGEREIARLERLGLVGETRGESGEKNWKMHALPSLTPERLLD